LVGVVASKDLSRGGDIGYCLVVMRHAILGAKMTEDDADFCAYFGESSPKQDPTRVQAAKIAQELADKREFLVPIGSVGQILYKKPGEFFGGYAIIKTPLRALRVDITVVSTASPYAGETAQKLRDALFMVVGERLTDAGSLPW
jgi:hypothetical protein